MELRELRYFLAVAQEENITKAAEYLYISQPSLSKQMQNLEKEIGRPLFVRGSRKITLTETGLLLKKRAEELVELYEKTESEISAPPGDVQGTIFIGGGESYAVKTVAQTIIQIQRAYPRIKFDFISGDAADITEKLDKGLIDFAILVDLASISKYNYLRLPLADSWGVLMRKDCPLADKEFVTPADLRTVPLICSHQVLDRGSVIYDWFGGKVDDLRVEGRYNLIYNASVFVREGIGCALGLDKLVNTSCDSDLCFKPLRPEVQTHLDVAWKKYAVFSKPSQLFLEQLQRNLAEYQN